MSFEEDDDVEYEYSDGDMDMEDWDAASDNPNAAPMSYKTTGHPDLPKQAISMKLAAEIQPQCNRECADASEALGLPHHVVTALLRESDWCKERLLANFFSDSEKILKAAGVFCHGGNAIAVSPEMQSTCMICFEDDCTMMDMPCGHAFCDDCWKQFCETAVSEGPSCVRQTCPQAKCTELVTEAEMKRVLGETSPLFQKYQAFQLRSFVESNPLYRWCPGPGCEKVAAAMSQTALESEGSAVQCDGCDTKFCLICGEEPHAPATCKSLAAWNEKCRNESETANWVLANTKPCPKCQARIEKNQGCNHMTCQKCRHEFCWICMGCWSEHGAASGGYYRCNRYDSDSDKTMSQAKRDLDRYLHYYKRFHAHSEAQAFAAKQLRDTDKRMVLLQESTDHSKWSEVEFLKTANEQLVECRRVLKFTYVHGYYFQPVEENKNHRERFEHHQEMLERFTEVLSDLTEKPIAQMDRTAVVNQTRVVDQFMKNILKCVEDDMDLP